MSYRSIALALALLATPAAAQITVNPPLGLPSASSAFTCTAAGVCTIASSPLSALTGLGTGVGTALGIAVGSAGGPVTNGGALGSPSSVGTLPAHTLGGTISGGGNKINNVIIGTVTPLAGAFTTVSATGSITATLSGSSPEALGFVASAALRPGISFVSTTASTGRTFAWVNAYNAQGLFELVYGTSAGGSPTNTALSVDAATGQVKATATTTATSVTTGAFNVAGGAAFRERVWADGLTTATGTPSSICRNANEITVNAALTCTVSSLDFKHDFVPISEPALPKLLAMDPGTFYYNDNGDRQRLGFAAEYMQRLDPRLADGYDADGHARSIDQNAILAMTVKAMQELAAEVRGLKAN